jgi:hypothetical protein
MGPENVPFYIWKIWQFVAVSGSITNHEDHEHHMKLAFNACHLDKDGHILYTQVS